MILPKQQYLLTLAYVGLLITLSEKLALSVLQHSSHYGLKTLKAEQQNS
jgi:hypothetical protein